MEKRPIVGITMGDSSGNGPEISVKALMKPEVYERCRPIVVGDAKCIEAALPTVEGADGWKVHAVADVGEALFTCGTIDVLDMDQVDLSRRLFKKDREKLAESMTAEQLDEAYRKSRRMCGEAAFQYVKKVIALAMAGKVDATVTNALNKDNIKTIEYNATGKVTKVEYQNNGWKCVYENSAYTCTKA